MSISQGLIISGICKGVRSEPYNGEQQYFVGFDVQQIDAYGSTISVPEEVSIYGEEVQHLIKEANELKGVHCIMPIVKTSNLSQRGRAYMRTYLQRDAHIIPVTSLVK